MKITRRFTTAGQDVYSTVEWTQRTSKISNADGSTVFEMRDAEEVLSVDGGDANASSASVRVAPAGTHAVNYAFDVTPARLVAGLVTERGIAPATTAGIRAMFPEGK